MTGMMHPDLNMGPAAGPDGGMEYTGAPLFVITDSEGIWVYAAQDLKRYIEDGIYTGEGADFDAIWAKFPGDSQLLVTRFERVGEIQRDFDESGDFERGQFWTTRVYAIDADDGSERVAADIGIYVKDH